MSKLICPFCQQELEDAKIHSSGLYFYCPNCYMKQKEKDDNYTATPRIWQELIRTRKALDVALDWLGQVATPEKCDDDLCREFTKRKLIEIKTALEQKDK